MQKGPELRITTKNNVTAASTITAVRASVLNKFFAMKMQVPCTTVATT
jgi:hypothetical protein